MPAATLQRLWRACHDVLVQKAVAAAESSGALLCRGGRPGAAGPPDDTGIARRMEEQPDGVGAAQVRRDAECGGLRAIAARGTREVDGRGPGVAAPVYCGLVERSPPGTIQQHVRASAAAFRAEIASHVAAGARSRPGLLLRDVLQDGGCTGARPVA